MPIDNNAQLTSLALSLLSMILKLTYDYESVVVDVVVVIVVALFIQ